MGVGAGEGQGTVQRLISWHLLPFAVIAFAAIPLSYLPPDRPDPALLGAAGGITVAAFAAAALVPRLTLPHAVVVLPPLAYLVAVAVLREAEGGAASGYGPLVLVSLLWAALYGERGHVVVVSVAVALVFLLPLVLIGGPAYPATEWRRLAVWMVVGPTVGIIVSELVRRVRDEAAAHGHRARALEAVAGIARSLGHGAETRHRICEAALTVASADAAFLVEPDGAGQLRATALVGVEPGEIVIAPGERSAIVTVYTAAERLYIPDAGSDPRVSRRILEATRAISMLLEPVLRRGEPVGVLAITWTRRVPVPDDLSAMVATFLATEAGVAIERADLLRRLDEMARTDELTGLPNRRSFDEALAREMSRARRTREPLALALLDLDRFKAYNDTHGHPAGDELLAVAARAWGEHLREADLLARWGGEEFVVVLPSVVSPDTADVVIDRLRSATPFGQTCSAGLAIWDGAEDAATFIARVDRALYEAKETGRDRTVVA